MNQVSQTILEISLYESSLQNQFTNIFTKTRYPIPNYKYLYMNHVSQTNLHISLHKSGIPNKFTKIFTRIKYLKPIYKNL